MRGWNAANCHQPEGSLTHWLRTALDLALPPVCCFCRRVCQPVPGYPGICQTCLSGLPWRYGRDRFLPDLLPQTAGNSQQLTSLICAMFYRSPVREALIRLKFGDAPELSVALGSLLSGSIRYIRPRPTALVAVPLHEDRMKQRGYNQAAMLVLQMSRQSGLPDMSAGLIRCRMTLRQSELTGRDARWSNMTDAFALNLPFWQGWLNERAGRRDLRTEHFLLIDDVLTTGATVDAAAQPLLRLGCRVSGLVVASDQGGARPRC